MKRISEKKLEAFAVGNMGKRTLSKKEIEEQKKKEDEAAAAHVFKEFVETFQEAPSASSKVWVKAGTYDAGSRREDNREKGKLYKPGSKLDEKSAAEKAQEYAKMLASDLKKDVVPLKKKSQEKKKSNLELFKEELRQIQEEREERHKYKHLAGQAVAQQIVENAPEARESGSFDTGDPNTTNLYLGNLCPKISEQQLMEIFGRYGPLASIKIMWPRSEEEKQRGRNCGFVAYMSRKDAERALRTLNGRYIMGYEMRLGWGKSVPIMNQPIFIPPTLLELTLPPPPSGLPFNAQPPPAEAQNIPRINYKEYTTEEEKENMERILYKSVVKVFIPTEKAVLNIIHRMIEFVIREGPMFEALIMSREIENPLFSFLFDNESPAHIYYRWKLFSLLQGDTPSEWNEKEFRMFKGGPIWKPPIANFYTMGMPEELVVDPDANVVHKGALSNAQRVRLEDLLRHITPERSRIGDAMIFCIEHADAADEICECITESLSNPDTLVSKKIARLYLISDLLHNCTVKVSNASFFRKAIEKHLMEVFENLHNFFNSMESRLKAEGLKSRVINVIRVWEEWTIYPKEFLAKLKSIFLGKQIAPSPPPIEEAVEELQDDIDGAPLSGDEKDDEDLDGIPLDGAALLKSALMRGLPEAMSIQKTTPTRRGTGIEEDDDIDGVPLDEDIDGIPLEKLPSDLSDVQMRSNAKSGAFIPSKWETVDPEQVEAQAITTSKWDTLDPPQAPKFYDSSDDEQISNNVAHHYDDDKRTKLREIEVKTMQYQDELEAGLRDLKSGWTISEQVEYFRRKLLKRDTDVADSPLSFINTKESRRGSESPDSTSRRARRVKRSPSPVQYNSSSSRSSPARASYKRSRSPLTTRREVSPTTSGTRSVKSSRRNRSRSLSDSPKKYAERTVYLSKSARYENSPRSRKSPSPGYSSSRSTKRDDREREYRNEKHKSRHKH
ncbi:PREDICTED: U2 snRNP-associated SURP motif-containing protein [Bactrocera latifrons]|uniref:U2 snRNP-associated SURP motif-containing protein n=2 Tax=Bactrocera latifrons TaxID=174628 RepID=A0A0K8VIY5_BACLA|nr:PREDICTED: U2 snRNP-associated SURP motif-containing protein [Bactrocera latifrons]